ncbi:MAG TPA: CoA pyrophosphatase [Dehalococcoidia bacterium]|nr:CoA pyrophosphatase [Dehalococcoidia bacterium]
MEESLRRLLDHRDKQSIIDDNRISSAVLVPIYRQDGEYHIIFIRRTETVKAHKGQISFPGGMCEKEDKSAMDTALRESQEEIGLLPEDVEILGELDDEITTTSNYIVSPFVGIIPWPYCFKKNGDEVDEILYVPLPALYDKDCLRPDTEILDGETVNSFAYHYGGNIIWGATARILYKFLEIIRQAGAD